MELDYSNIEKQVRPNFQYSKLCCGGREHQRGGGVFDGRGEVARECVEGGV